MRSAFAKFIHPEPAPATHVVSTPLSAAPGALSRAQENFLHFARFAAANLVVVGHIGAIYGVPVPNYLGGFGVSIFFLLSGFLIFSAAARRTEAQDAFLPFMIDRIARIFTPFIPALLLAVAANIALDLGKWGEPGVNTGPAAFLANLFLLNDYPIFSALSHLGHGDAFTLRSYNTAEPFWTIPIEFWTYVFFGVAFFAGYRRERVSWKIVVALLAVSAPVVLWNSFAGGGNGLTLTWAIGAFAGYCWRRQRPDVNDPRAAWLAGALIAIGALGVAGRLAKGSFNFYETQSILFVAMILFGALLSLRRLNGPESVFGTASRLLADYSYSLYLVHNTIIIIVLTLAAPEHDPLTAAVAFLAAQLGAIAMYVLFERRHKEVGAHLKAWIRRRHERHIQPPSHRGPPSFPGGEPHVPSASADPAAG